MMSSMLLIISTEIKPTILFHLYPVSMGTNCLYSEYGNHLALMPSQDMGAVVQHNLMLIETVFLLDPIFHI